MLGGGGPAAFEYFDEANEIAVDIGGRICERIAPAGLRREVHDPIDALRLEQCRDTVPVLDVQLDEPKPRQCPEAIEAGMLEARIVVGVEVVQPDDFVAAPQQLLRNVGADEARRAGEDRKSTRLNSSH